MTRQTLALTLSIVALSLTGCFSDDGGGGNDAEVGRLTITGVEGLRYETASQSGQTNGAGEFRYYDGETISFWIGDLQIAQDVPAKPFLSPIDFSAANREQLYAGASDAYNLSTHTLVEERLARLDPVAINVTRLLLILDEDKVTRLGDDKDPRNNIKLTDRVLEQFNRALAATPETIDFTADIAAFAANTPNSPINTVLQQVCFFPPDDRRCEALADQSELDKLEADIAELEADIDPIEQEIEVIEASEPVDEARKKELLAQLTALEEDLEKTIARLQKLQMDNRDILDARRSVADRSATTVETFLVEQTRRYNSIAGRDYFITPYELNISAADTSMKTLTVQSRNGAPELSGLDAMSTNPGAILVPRWDAASREVDFHATGQPATEAEVRLAFRPAADYRWFQLQLRPIVD